jgi:hypothetical protein
MQGKVIAAANFLIEHLAGREVASTELSRLATEAGICERTLSRAKILVGASCRKSGVKDRGWYTSIPGSMAKQRFCTDTAIDLSNSRGLNTIGQISTDWTSVAIKGNVAGSEHKIDIPESRKAGGTQLRVKVGKYEIEADESFSVNKLMELLRELSGEGQ